MIHVHTRLDPERGDTWVVASYRVDVGQIAEYQVRVAYLDSVGGDSERHFKAARELARNKLEGVLRDYRGY